MNYSQTFQHVDLDKPTLVLIDTSVFMHRFSGGNMGVCHKSEGFLPLLKAHLTALVNCSWLPIEIVDTVVSTICTIDVKRDGKYWRHDWLLDPDNYLRVPKKVLKSGKLSAPEQMRLDALGLWETVGSVPEEMHQKLSISYKAGRSLPDYRFKKIKANTLGWIEGDQLNTKGIALPYYESDDLMAAVVKLNRDKGHPYNLIIYTVDCDLMGLIDPSVTWVCMAGYAPGIRDTLEVCNSWGNRPDSKGKVKLGHIDTWRDVWTRKGEVGDASDNLPASQGVLLPVIDLIDPPVEHQLHLRPDVKAAINNAIMTGSRPNTTEASRATRYIVNRGSLPCFRPYADCPINLKNY